MKGEIEIIYVILEYVSIILFLFLFGYCISRSINYTLQVFCIVAIFNNINESTLLFTHDHSQQDNQDLDQDLGTAAYGTTECTVSAFFEQFLPLMMNCLATCMAFNMWYLVVLKAKFEERKFVKWYCLFSVVVALMPTCVAAVLLRGKAFFSAFPRQFYCNLADSAVTRGTFAGPMLAVAIPGILASFHTAICLMQHYVFVRKTLVLTLTPSSNVIIERSHCIRLLVFCLSIGIVVIMAILQALVEPKSNDNNSNNRDIISTSAELGENHQNGNHSNLVMFSEFSGSLVGFFAFLIFGTTRDAFETLGKVVCCRYGCRTEDEDHKESRRQKRQHGRRNTRLSQAEQQEVDDTIYYNGHENHSHTSISIEGNDDGAINYSRNYTKLYLGINDSDDDNSDYRYPSSDNSQPSSQINSSIFERQFGINNTISNGQSEDNSSTTLTTTASDTTAASSHHNDNNNNNNNTSSSSSVDAKRSSMGTGQLSTIGPIPPPPLKPLPEKPTFQGLMIYGLYHANNNYNSSDNNRRNYRHRRRRSNGTHDLESGLPTDLLQTPPPSELPSLPPPPLLRPPCAMYFPE